MRKVEETRMKNIPICDRQPRPASWPKAWASLHREVQDLWAGEGIEDAQDLRMFYTTEQEVKSHLGQEGVKEAAWSLAVTHWKDAARASSTAVPPGVSDPPMRPAQKARTTEKPLSKKRVGPPRQRNEQGLVHLRWHAKQKLKEQNAVRAQGLNPAREEHLDAVWTLYLRAGRRSSLWRPVKKEEEESFKSLLLRPITRHADSMPSRLAAWKR